MVLTEQLQRFDLVGELEANPADLAGVLAAAVEEVLDRDLGQRRSLVASAG